MQDELNSIEENEVLDKTVSLKINNKIVLAFESKTPLSISEAVQYTVDEDYHEKRLYLDFMIHELGKEVLIKRYEFFLQNMEDLADKTLSIYLGINLYRIVFLTIIEGELNQEVDYSTIIYRFDRFQIPSEKNDTVIEVETGATVFERGFVISGIVTPGNNRFISSCDFCGKFFMFRMFHVGFSDVDYYYCDRCTNYLAVSIYDQKYNRLLDKLSAKRISPFSQPNEFSDYDIQLNLDNYQLIEDHFVSCTCGGHFRYLANCLCPYCKSPYVNFFNDIFRKADHYYVVEMVVPKCESFYGEKYWKYYKADG
ncbi:MAG: hypothetical protein ACFFA5_10135 [Promethearchaeota archaeon]